MIHNTSNEFDPLLNTIVEASENKLVEPASMYGKRRLGAIALSVALPLGAAGYHQMLDTAIERNNTYIGQYDSKYADMIEQSRQLDVQEQVQSDIAERNGGQ